MKEGVEDRRDRTKRMYPDAGLKRVEGEYRSMLVEQVRATFRK